MKIDRVKFTDALALAVKVIDRKPVISDYANVKMTFGDGLILEAMNNSRHDAIKIVLPYEREESGVVLVDGYRLYEIVRQLKDDDISIQSIENKLKLQNRIALVTSNGNFDTPVASTDGVNLSSMDFLNLINTSLCGIQEESYVEALKGSVDSVQFISGEGFECYAFDGKRLSRSTGDCKDVANYSIPIGMLKQGRGILAYTTFFQLSEDDHHFFITDKGMTYSYRKSHKQVPDIKSLWNKIEVTEFAEFDVTELLSSLNLVRTLLDPIGTKGAKWNWGDGLTISVNSSNGEISEHLDVKHNIQGEWGYNTDWIIQTLNTVEGKVKIGINQGKMKIVSNQSEFVLQALNFV